MDPPECTGHAHDPDHEDGLGLSLRQYIDFPKVFCLNEEVSGSGAAILKLHEERLIPTPSLQSPEGDPELILYIPFTEAVTIQSITIHCAPATTSATAVTRNAPCSLVVILLLALLRVEREWLSLEVDCSNRGQALKAAIRKL